MAMKILSTVILLSICSISFSQNALLKKANYNYEHLNFWLAKSQYKRLVKATPAEETLVLKLASCYKLTHENERAYTLLQTQFTSKGFSSPYGYELFGELCLLTQRYDQAKTIFDKMVELRQAILDSKEGPMYPNATIESTERLSWKCNADINSLTWNSTKADFGGYPYLNGSLIFLSTRGTSIIKRKWAGNGDGFLNYYAYKKNGDVKQLKKHANTKFHEGPLCLHPNGKWVFFTRNNMTKGVGRTDKNGIQNLMIYRAEITNNGKWKNVSKLKINSNEFSVGHPTLSKDGSTIYFSSDMPGGYGGADLYTGKLTPEGEISDIKNLGNQINTQGNEVFAWLNNDLLFFSSDGLPSLGGLDIQVAKLMSGNNVGKPKNVGVPLNSNADDFAITFTAENKGYFSSNRTGFGSDDIYAFNLNEPFKFNILVNGSLNELNANVIIPNQPLLVINDKGEVTDTITTDINGNFELELEPGSNITIKSIDPNYVAKEWTYVATNEANQQLDLSLLRQPDLTLNTLITDKKTGKPIEGVKISISDKTTGKLIFDNTTGTNGYITNMLDDLTLNQSLNFNISIKKTGYLDKSVDFNYQVTKTETINLHELIDMGIGKIEVGTNIADLIDIKPIYFDLGKYNIRTDAALELDKIVAIMNQYPQMVVELGSHTDCRSSKAFNQKLSQNRAKASADYIKSRITTPSRISGVGYGESKLKVNCPCEGTVKSTCPEEEHAKNRRTEFIIKKMN